YADLIAKYFAPEDSNSVSEKSKEQKDAQARLDEINSKIQKSKEFEEVQKKITDLETELAQINKELGVVSSVDEKVQEAQAEFDKYKNFARFNLQKIHDDLVKINAEIAKFEEQLLEQKVVDIKTRSSYYDYDKGKIG